MGGGAGPQEIAPALRAGVLRLARRLRVERDRSALSNNKIAVLSHLARVGVSSPSRISRVERQHPQSLTRVFADLESGGLVERLPDPADARRRVLRLTAEGRAALDADMQLRDEWLAAVLAELEPGELQVLGAAAGILDRLGDGADRRRT